jgi:hypothetical protein
MYQEKKEHLYFFFASVASFLLVVDEPEIPNYYYTK